MLITQQHQSSFPPHFIQCINERKDLNCTVDIPTSNTQNNKDNKFTIIQLCHEERTSTLKPTSNHSHDHNSSLTIYLYLLQLFLIQNQKHQFSKLHKNNPYYCCMNSSRVAVIMQQNQQQRLLQHSRKWG